VRCSQPPGDVVHAYYKYYFFLNTDMLASGWDRDRIVEEINDAGGQCGSGSCPEIYKGYPKSICSTTVTLFHGFYIVRWQHSIVSRSVLFPASSFLMVVVICTW